MSNFNLHGLSVSNGIAIGKAYLLSDALVEVEHYAINKKDITKEVKRLKLAINQVNKDLNKIKKDFFKINHAEFEGLINTHLMMLKDRSFNDDVLKIIKTKKCNAEWAVKVQLDKIITRFDQINDSYIKERKLDVIQVAERITKALLGRSNHLYVKQLDNNSILIGHDISPADALIFKHNHYEGFITEIGGTNSHTAILARSLNIPSIVSIPLARALIKNDDVVIVDGDSGTAIINPTDQILNEYESKKNLWNLEQKKLSKIKNFENKTLDGNRIFLMANIEELQDLKTVKENKADGIGLFRTEFLFMNRIKLPDENEQFENYRSIVKSMRGKEIIIRTLDSGADKMTVADTKESSNPALGLRAIRLCLSEPRIFLTQLRAILRASAFGKVKILIPMISSIDELKQTKLLIERAKQSLTKEKIKYDKKIEVGGMVEVPAVAINANFFAKELDFLSIGTNDLIQYTLAIDRTDDSVSHLYNSIHPSVLKLMAETIKAGKKYNKQVAVCGEMAGDPKLTRLLLGMGVENFSMHPSSILHVKKQILSTNISKLKGLINKIMNTNEPEVIETLILKINQKSNE